MDLKRKIVTSLAVFAVVLGLFAIPGTAAPTKQFSVTAPTSVTAATTSVTVRVKNEVPNGNSNINSVYLTATGASGFRFTGSVTPGAATVSNVGTNVGQKISVRSFTSIKPTKFIDFTFGVVVPNLACGSGTITWGGAAFAGDSLNGDQFALLQAPFSQLSTAITTGCTTISVDKFNDTNVDGMKDADEVAPPASASFDFQLKQGASVLQTITWPGTTSFTPRPSGSYSVCEVAATGWTQTKPASGACVPVAASGSAFTATFGNAADATITVTKYNDLNVNGISDDDATLSGWEFTVFDGDTSVATASTNGSGTVTFTVPPGPNYSVCETDSKLDQSAEGFADAPWFNTDPGGSEPCKDADTSSGSSTDLSFGNAIGNLDCGGVLIERDGDVKVTRLNNTDGELPCILKPADLSANFSEDGDSVLFLATGTQKAAYMFEINWGPVDKPPLSQDNPVPADAFTEVDIPGGDHPIEWCESSTVLRDSDGNFLPTSTAVLPAGEVVCLVSQDWSIVDGARVQKTEVIYAEADLVLSCKTCR